MSCGNPPGIANGKVNAQTSYSVGSAVQYTCNAAYTMTGSSTLNCVAAPTPSGPSNPPYIWQGTYPVCTLEFLETAWFWLLIGILGLITLGLMSCLIWFCIRYCCNNCRGRRKVGDVENVEERGSLCSRLCCGCCFYCMRTPEDTKDGCCDYFGCCGYAGCCSCCCWCCRCCREIVEPERIVRMRKGKQKHRPIFSMKRQKSIKDKNKKKKIAMIKLNSQRQFVKSTMLPTTQMVRSMIQDDPNLFRKVAKKLPVWMPHTHSIRDINTSTK
ncbi:uncharacterized protein LOC132558836 [Ylistrum balloti]|uniref:uncharacterized protein LOC132558836 n=1 Tax=Ylistrum balloti TaxID=509963 RepID=UPI002905C9E7|nr:uncharacterized protein LOC132558836 [Ylistrum balloti]